MSFLDDGLFLLDSVAIGSSSPTLTLDAAAFFDGFDLSTVDAASADVDESVSITSLLSNWSDADPFDLTSDSCDSSGSVAGSPPPSQSSSSHEPEKKRKKTHAAAGVVLTAANEPVTSPVALLKRPRKHNRLEILKLRDEVEALETKLSKLHKADAAATSSQQQQLVRGARTVKVSVAVAAQYALRQEQKQIGSKNAASAYTVTFPRSVWLDVAVEQYAELQLAESKNRRLREAVDRRAKLYNSFQTLVRSTNGISDVDQLLGNHMTSCKRHDPLRPTLPSLFQSVAELLPQTDAVLAAIGLRNDLSSVFHSCQTKQHAVQGPTFELTTNTPVVGDYKQFSQTLWDRITDCSGQHKISLPTPMTRLKTMQITLETPDGRAELSGILVIRQFEQKDRVVLTLAATYLAEGSNVVFREEGWVVASALDAPMPDYLPSWARPTSRTLMQTVYRMYAEKQDPLSATGSSPFTEVPDKDTRFFQEFVIQAMGDKVRENKIELQASLLSVSSVDGLQKMTFADCPLIDSPCC